jgi:hypothetical protein
MRSLATGAPPFMCACNRGPRTISWLATPPIRAFRDKSRTEKVVLDVGPVGPLFFLTLSVSENLFYLLTEPDSILT